MIVCVNCDKQFKRDVNANNDIVPVNSETGVGAPNSDAQVELEEEEDIPTPTDEELAEHEERRKRNERASVEIGEKLLAGWTM